MDQVPMAEWNLQGVEPGFADPASGLGESLRHGGDLASRQGTGRHAVGGAGDGGGRYPIALCNELGIDRPAGMVDVGHDQPARLVDGAGQPAQALGHGVFMDAELCWQFPPVELDVERFGGHQPHAPLRAADVEGDVAVGHLTGGCRVPQFHGGHQDAVGEGQPAQPQRLE